MVGISEDAIRERAYQIWEREGRPHGRDYDHWVRARVELAAEAAAAKAPATAPKAAATQAAATAPADPQPAAKAKAPAKKATAKK